MRRPRSVATALIASLVAVLLTWPLSGADGKPSRSQAFFQKALLGDAKTTPGIKKLLQSGGGFVSPAMQFADITGDTRSDAIVLVDDGGVAGAVALYMFSTDGKGASDPLRVVYRSQQLYRATVRLTAGGLILSTPRFREGDDVCCPDRTVQRTYLWSEGAGTLKLHDSQEIATPVAAPTTTPPATVPPA